MIAVKKTKIGREPVVVLPLKEWERIEDALEDLEALSSPKYLRRIAHARAQASQGKVVSLEDIRKEFGV